MARLDAQLAQRSFWTGRQHGALPDEALQRHGDARHRRQLSLQRLQSAAWLEATKHVRLPCRLAHEHLHEGLLGLKLEPTRGGRWNFRATREATTLYCFHQPPHRGGW